MNKNEIKCLLCGLKNLTHAGRNTEGENIYECHDCGHIGVTDYISVVQLSDGEDPDNSPITEPDIAAANEIENLSEERRESFFRHVAKGIGNIINRYVDERKIKKAYNGMKRNIEWGFKSAFVGFLEALNEIFARDKNY